MSAPAGAGETAENDRPGGGDRGKRAARLARLPVAFVAGAAALAVTLFQLHDRIWPPVNVQGGEVVAVDLVDVVSYQTYVTQHPTFFPDPKGTITRAGAQANRKGVVVEVVLRMEGLRGRHCHAAYTVYRTPLNIVYRQPSALDKCTARVQNGDEGGWAAWVLLPKTRLDRTGRPIEHRYFVRFDLFDDHGLLIGPGKSTTVFGWNGEGVTS